MSERPAAAGTVTWGGWAPLDGTPWGKSLWGTTIDYGMGQKLVIDKKGAGIYTDAAGETGTWDPELFGWRDEDGNFKDPTFGIRGMEEVDEVIDGLEQAADRLQSSSPDAAQTLRDRAKELWERWHDTDAEPYPYD